MNHKTNNMNYKQTVLELIITYNLYSSNTESERFEAIKNALKNATYFELLQLRNEFLYNQLIETSITQFTVILAEITIMITKLIKEK